jgi:hypothetical protein
LSTGVTSASACRGGSGSPGGRPTTPRPTSLLQGRVGYRESHLSRIERAHRFLPARNLKKQNDEGGAARYGATYGRASPPRKQAERSSPGRFGRRERRSRTPCLSHAPPSRWPAKTGAKRELAQNARFELALCDTLRYLAGAARCEWRSRPAVPLARA